MGKRIARIVHERVSLGDGRVATVVDALVLEDGTALIPHAIEAEDELVATILKGAHRWNTEPAKRKPPRNQEALDAKAQEALDSLGPWPEAGSAG